MNLGQLIDKLEALREKRGDLIQVVIRTHDGEKKSWSRIVNVAVWQEDGYLDEISLQNFEEV